MKLILNKGIDRMLSLDELITAAIVGLKLPDTRESRALLSSTPWLGAIGQIPPPALCRASPVVHA